MIAHKFLSKAFSTVLLPNQLIFDIKTYTDKSQQLSNKSHMANYHHRCRFKEPAHISLLFKDLCKSLAPSDINTIILVKVPAETLPQ